ETARIIVDRFEVFDAVRLAADIGVDRQRHDLGAMLSLGVEAIELIDRALGEILALVMLNDHDTDVVDLHRIRERYQRPFGGADGGRRPTRVYISRRRRRRAPAFPVAGSGPAPTSRPDVGR